MTKKEQILLVAEELFAEFGYDGTSIRMIAQKADINIAMISYYFGSKELLFTELVEYRTSIFRLKLQDIQKDFDDPVKQIEKLVDTYVDKVTDNYRFHRILHRQISIQQNSEMNQQIRMMLMKNVTEVRNIIESGIRKNVFREVDVDLIIITFFSTVAQFANNTCLAMQILEMDQGKTVKDNPELKTRIKEYVTGLLKKYLLANND
jgi:AcrR family transcriptional regulator